MGGSVSLWVGYFIEEAIERGFDADELPAYAICFADLWEYHGEVGNGGHAQYYENEGESRPRLKSMADLFETIGLPQHGKLLKDFEHFAIENEDRLVDLYVAGDSLTAKEMFYDFDDRFALLERTEGKLGTHLETWLLQQLWIVPADGLASMPQLRSPVPDPPSQDERRAARLRRRHAENHGHWAAFVQRRRDFRRSRSSSTTRRPRVS